MSKRWPGKTVIGLTGNIATGKSVVRRMLEHLGAFGIDADGLAHRAMSPGAPAYKPIIETFGRWILTPDGRIDREKLGKVVFADPDALARLEAITHPIVLEVIDLLIRRSKQKVVVIEAIKLFESGLAERCDSVWVVDAPPDVQVKRLVEKRKMSEEEARRRIAAQPPQSDKLARASVIIHNAKGFEDTYRQVREHFDKLVGAPAPAPAVTAPPPKAAAKPPKGEAPEEEKEAVEKAITVRRSGPEEVEQVAAFISKIDKTSLSREEMMERFGQKAYMAAYTGNQIVGLAGWQVENLITRIDEFRLAPDAPVKKVVSALIEHIEKGSNDLQSEIALLFLKNDTPDEVRKAVMAAGYTPQTASDLKVPDWREAARESAPPDSYMVVKRLRADRVLRPI
ncbi:MAG TPA: dephospho-CoA kinase [Chloroflexi bacterium]|nr:dephospho-CoA kinase [Chloroflexota bacterium]